MRAKIISKFRGRIRSPQSPIGGRFGLTLIELLVVVGILTLLATFSVGMMRDLLRGQKVNQAANLVQQYLQNAQIKAIANGRPVAVFMDRVGLGDGVTGLATPASYTVTRLQLGEVFPPYVGDVENTFGELRDLNGDGKVEHIDFGDDSTSPNYRANVLSGFGDFVGGNLVGGFIEQGDLLEIEGSSFLYVIGNYRAASENLGTNQILVPFSDDMLNRNDMLNSNDMSNSNFDAAPPLYWTAASKYRRIKIYRQPTKSLAGFVSLPRGTCIDLAQSGFGPSDVGADVSATFSLGSVPWVAPPILPNYFARIGVVFDAQGRMSYLMFERNIGSGLERRFVSASGKLHLMVGRTDQVLPGYGDQPIELAALKNVRDELPISNLMEMENIWVTCNPFTGDVTTSPVASVEVDLTKPLKYHVREARRLATAGVSN